MPDITENCLRIQVKDLDFFADESIHTVSISEDQGIKSIIGKRKADLGGTSEVQSYLFDKDKWPMADAEKWVYEHKKGGGIERRSFDAEHISFSKEEHNVVHLRGLAIPYNKLSNNPIPGMPSNIKERIHPGTFRDSLSSGRDVLMVWNHELKYIFGRTSKGTLKLAEDNDGISFDNVPPESSWAKDLLPSIKRGDYSHMSFNFGDDLEPEWTLENGEYVRNVRKATLYEISLVPCAVYETTSVGARSSEFVIVDNIVLPDPVFEARMAEQDLRKFQEVEEKFNNLRQKWL